MVKFQTIQAELEQLATPERAISMQRYFKTQAGGYGAGDQFLGVSVPNQRLVAKQYQADSDETTIQDCLNSPLHELRLTGVLILVGKYKADKRKNNHEKWVNLYLKNSHRMNNWDLVDSSAHFILGDWLAHKDKQILHTLAESDLLWNNRIAIISTLHFIRNNEVTDMLLLVEKLMHHPHDLMHKANGWMLREGWQRKPELIEAFLEKFGAIMPRTSLRYAIEKMSPTQRKYFMDLKKKRNSLFYMKNGINIKNLQHLKFYFIGFALFFTVCIFLLSTMGKGESFLYLNQWHNKSLDLFFKNYTFLGDGLFAVILSLILFFFVKTQRLSVEILTSYIVSGLLAQVFKNIFKHPRPRAFFSPQDYAYFIDGVSIQNHVSFPSGHTTTAFALVLILANRTNNKFLQCIFLILAILAGYSRIYLAQHFLEDVFAGAFLGTFISVMCLLISSAVPSKKHVVLKKWKIRND